jgi:hypothetical protein
MKRVRVDFNARDERGLIPVSLARFESDVQVGEVVQAYDGEEGFYGDATVVEIDNARGFAHLDIGWDQLRDPSPKVETQSDLVIYTDQGWFIVEVKTSSTASSLVLVEQEPGSRTHIASVPGREGLLAS